MCLGLGPLSGWLALTGHHWPLLVKDVTQSSIKEQVKIIHTVLVNVCFVID